MIHVILGALGLLGIVRAVWCAWLMHAPSAGPLRRLANAAMGALSVALLWAAMASSASPG